MVRYGYRIRQTMLVPTHTDETLAATVADNVIDKMIDKISSPLAKLSDLIDSTKSFLDATSQKQATELLSLQDVVKQQAELIKLLSVIQQSNPRGLSEASWPLLPPAGPPSGSQPHLGPRHHRVNVSTDPKVAQRVALATKQLLIDYGPLKEGEELRPSMADGQKELRQLFNDWIDIINSSETVEGQPPPPPSRAVCNVSIFECPSLLLEFDSADSKSQFAEMIEKNNFILKELSPKACIRPRTYAVIFRFVPCNGSFDPNKEDHLCDIEKDNDLQANSISAAKWCKRPNRRSPGQTTATLKVACTNPDIANSLLTGRIRVANHLVHVRKDLCIPIRCVRCQEYGHIQDTCIGIDRCSNCSSKFHQADKCDSAPTCISCGASSKHPVPPQAAPHS